MPVVADRHSLMGGALMDLARERYGRLLSNVHRLDTEASGVVLCAKTKAALDFLSGQFQSKTVEKAYLAMAIVLPPEKASRLPMPVREASGALLAEFSVDVPLGPDENNPGKMKVLKKRGGKPAETRFRLLEPFGRFAWLECRPLSGLTHQIRVHLAACGAPVLNDTLYGDPSGVLLLSDLKRGYKGRDEEKPLLSNLALHASSLGFTHPATRDYVEISAPIPEDLQIALKYLRKFATPRAARSRSHLSFRSPA
jgi:RluA family pseudouridine synthase